MLDYLGVSRIHLDQYYYQDFPFKKPYATLVTYLDTPNPEVYHANLVQAKVTLIKGVTTGD